MYETRLPAVGALKKVGAPRVRLELTTYRLTAGRAADCAIQELAYYLLKPEISKNVPPAGIEPATNRLKVERST